MSTYTIEELSNGFVVLDFHRPWNHAYAQNLDEVMALIKEWDGNIKTEKSS